MQGKESKYFGKHNEYGVGWHTRQTDRFILQNHPA